jgi:hypothetical protein
VDLTLSDADTDFRGRVRAMLETALPADIRSRASGRDRGAASDVRRWQQILHANGWGAVHWPVEYGGLGATALQQYLFELECTMAGAPLQLPFGLRMIGPVLMRYGNDAQRAYHLPRILSGADWWCQGYSEPGAGSDLASLKTQAVLEGDEYVVNGQKCWNTLGQHADWIFMLVRTDATAKAQRGISLLLVDMRTPGITVRPTRLLDGTFEVNEVFFDNVRVPVANRVGEENAGWTYAKFLLAHERTNIAGVGASKRELRRIRALAASTMRGSMPLGEDPVFQRKLARAEIDLLALEYTNLRMLSSGEGASATATAASILKIRGSEIRQTLSELLVEAAGPDALKLDLSGEAGMEPMAAYLNLRKLSIFGGSNEIQRNIIAQSLVGV